MNRTPASLLVLPLVLTAVASLPTARPSPAFADEPLPVGTLATPVDSAPRAPSAPAPPRPWPPWHEMAAPVEAKRSPVPKPAEWDASSYEELSRPEAARCHVNRVREWMRVRCDMPGGQAALLAGARGEVFLWASEESAEAVFSLRRGTRRVIQLTSTGRSFGYNGFIPGASPVLIQESWMEGEAAPTVTVL